MHITIDWKQQTFSTNYNKNQVTLAELNTCVVNWCGQTASSPDSNEKVVLLEKVSNN